ncbi:MAG TPA: hypothetical protein VFI99_05685 [Nocardioides sp.]|nr:hypothetical protein [Nocardioides sp.]
MTSRSSKCSQFGTIAHTAIHAAAFRADYDTEQVTMSFPRGCLGRPKWVRVDMTNFMFRGNTAAGFQEITDNPHSADADSSLTRRLYLPAS